MKSALSALRGLRRSARGVDGTAAAPPDAMPQDAGSHGPVRQDNLEPDDIKVAEALQDRGLLNEAIAEYGRLADRGVRTTEALIRKATLHRQLGEVRDAVASLERAQAAEPQNPLPQMRLGEIAEGLGRSLAAAHHHRRAVDLALRQDDESRVREMRTHLTLAYLNLQHFDQAHTVARALPKGAGEWSAGVRHEALTRFRQARASVLKLLGARRSAPGLSDEEQLLLARGLLSLGRMQAAAAVCRRLMLRHPEWRLMSYFMTDVITRQAGPQDALAFLRANERLPRGSKEFMGSELRLLKELQAWDEILDRMGGDHEPEQFDHAHHAVVMAMLILDRRAELERYCVAWMRRSPQETTPAACIAFLHARDNGLIDAAGHRRSEPGPVSVHLVQFWNAEAPPQDVRHTMDSWTRHNPHWRQTVFNESRAQVFLRDQLGSRAVQAFGLCFHPAMMADFFRVAFLSVRGGLYVDADEDCMRPLDNLLPNLAQAEILAPLSGGFPGFVDNNLLGARPGSRILQITLERMVEDILAAAQEGRRPAIWSITGPGAVTRGLARYIADGAAGAGEMFFLSRQQYRSAVRTEDNLAYKKDPAANWRIAAG